MPTQFKSGHYYTVTISFPHGGSSSTAEDTLQECFQSLWKDSLHAISHYSSITADIDMNCTSCHGTGEVIASKRGKLYTKKPCKCCKGIGSESYISGIKIQSPEHYGMSCRIVEPMDLEDTREKLVSSVREGIRPDLDTEWRERYQNVMSSYQSIASVEPVAG